MSIKYWNRPGEPSESQILDNELRKITGVDVNNEFRFEVTFTGSGRSGLNNFNCKVFLKCDEQNDLIATLHRGDESIMRQIRKDCNEEA